MFPGDNIKYVQKCGGCNLPDFTWYQKTNSLIYLLKNIKMMWLRDPNSASNLLRNHGFILTNKNGAILDMFSIIKSSNSNFF